MDPITLALIGVGVKGLVNTGVLGELTPAASAQRKLFKEAKERTVTGAYGLSAAEKAAQQASAQDNVAGAWRRQRAALLRGGAASPEALAVQARGENAASAQIAGAILQGSNAYAMQQRATDAARIDAQAKQKRDLYQSEGFKKGAGEVVDVGTSAVAGGKMTPEQMQQLLKKGGAGAAPPV